jgi:hypothetical protein
MKRPNEETRGCDTARATATDSQSSNTRSEAAQPNMPHTIPVTLSDPDGSRCTIADAIYLRHKKGGAA